MQNNFAEKIKSEERPQKVPSPSSSPQKVQNRQNPHKYRNGIVVPIMAYPRTYQCMPVQYPYKCPVPVSMPYRPVYTPMPAEYKETTLRSSPSALSKPVKLSHRSQCSQTGEEPVKLQREGSSEEESARSPQSQTISEKPKRKVLLPLPAEYNLQSHQVQAPSNNLIHVPIMNCRKPELRCPSCQASLTRSSQKDAPMTFAANPLFKTLPKKTNPHEASALKDQIIRNVEQLFEMTRPDRQAGADKKEPLVDERLVETILQCCLEVETYWKQIPRESNVRSLILGCCKTIRHLTANNFRQSHQDNLQELTMSLVVLFLIFAMC